MAHCMQLMEESHSTKEKQKEKPKGLNQGY